MASGLKENGGAQSARATAPIALFYRRPLPVGPGNFQGKSLARKGSLEFARGTNAVPLNVVEFALAQRHYPIVFTADEKPSPIALVGLRKGENLFVGNDGRWAERFYVPAYVRRYPFILMQTGKANQLALCADAASDLIVAGDSNPFYVEGKASALVQSAGKICGAFQNEAARTEQFCAALAEHDLLGKKSAGLKSGTEKLKFGPFKAVDPKKLGALPDALIAKWQRNGWLPAISAHLFSMNNWAGLANRNGRI